MQADSTPVSSTQLHAHPKLPELIQRHLANAYRKPVASHNQQAFNLLLERLTVAPRPLVLDSFCGTGHSTAALAQRHPDHLIVGIDKSAHRLAKHPHHGRGNTILLQAECEDIWQLLLQARIKPDYHYLLYPNPWPKAKHLQRRIHGHPAFRYLLQLGGIVELRSNWQIYVEEFGVAMHLAGQRGRVQQVEPEQPITLFEQKYQASGHGLWRFLSKPLNRVS
ncbi:MAG: SAM-dependent methyltransferase [Halioglobus sp.]